MDPSFYFRLLPNLPVYANRFDGWEQVANIFRNVWARLCSDVTERLLSHWRPAFTDLRLQPLVSFAPYRPSVVNGWQGVARTALSGMRVEFCYADLLVMPEDVAEVVIAEELAHVYCFATEEENHREWNRDGAERVVGCLLRQWGFNRDLLQQWAESNPVPSSGVNPSGPQGQPPER